MSASAQDQISLLHQQAEAALDRNDLPAARSLVDRAAELAREAFGEKSPEVANALFVQASIARLSEDLPLANRLYEDALAIMENLPGHDADLANSMIILSQRYAEQGNLERAAQLRQRARQVILERLPIDDNLTLNLAIHLGSAATGVTPEETLALEHDLAQAALNANRPRPALFFFSRLAGRFANLNRLDEATQALQQAHQWLDRLDDATLSTILGSLLEMANVHLTLEDPTQAAALFLKAGSLLKDRETDTYQVRIDITYGLAKAYRMQGDFTQAETRYQEVLTRTARLYGQDHPRTAEAAGLLGGFYLDREQYTQAEQYFSFALEIQQAKLAPDDPIVAETLNNLGICTDQTGQFRRAEEYYRRALAIREKRLGRTHPDTLTTLFNLAELARIRGDRPSAESRFQELVQTPGIPEDLLALAKNNLGDLYVSERRFAEAQPLLQSAYEIRSRVFGVESGKAARSLDSLGELEFDQGNYAEAKGYHQQALAIYQREHMARFANSAAIAFARAVAFEGDLAAAIPLLEEALKQARAAYGENHTQVAGTLGQLALFYAALSRWKDARDAIQQAVKIEDDNLVEVLLSASRGHASSFMAEARKLLSLYLGTLLDDPAASQDDVRFGYSLIQRRKGIETRLLRMLRPGRILPTDKTAQMAAWIEQKAGLSRQLLQLQLAGPAAGDQSKAQVAALQQQISQIESSLAESGMDRTIDTIVYPLPAHAVAAALPDNNLLVEFLNVPDYAAGFRAHGVAPRRYAAFVLKAGKPPEEENIIADVDALETIFSLRPAEDFPVPVLMDLGEAAQIDAGVEELLSDVELGDSGKGSPRWRQRGRYLYNRLVQPLETHLQGAAHLVLATDGALNMLPFEILPDSDGKLILDRFTTSYVQVGREVIRFWEHFNKGDPALVIAAPDYALSAPAGSPDAQVQAADDELVERLSALQDAPRFTDLSNTLPEGQAVAAALQVTLHSGAGAVETLLKDSHSPEIVHMATHGFFLRHEDPAENAQDYLAARSGLADPLERSGLVLAGANAYLDRKAPPAEAEDGILFASEIVDLDLRQTDLVCLSTCQSGEGDIRLGEGLQGLRSAFAAAGCRSLVCALWEIPDLITRQIIEQFYSGLLAGLPRAQALCDAKQALRKTYPREARFWAGLVLDGNPGPLYRFKFTSELNIATINWREWMEDDAPRKPPETPAEFAEDFYRQGMAALKASRTDAAFQGFDAAIAQQGASPEIVSRARYQRAGLLRDQGRYAEALEEYNRLFEATDLPHDLRVGGLSDRGTTYMLAGQYPAAIEDYNSALAREGITPQDRAWLLVNRGNAYRLQGEDQAAITDFTAVIQMDGVPPDQLFKALLNRGDMYRHAGAYDDAIQDLSQALELPEGDPSAKQGARLSRALAYFERKEYALVIQDLTLLLADKDLSVDYAELSLSYRAQSYLAIGQPAQAQADYQAMLALPGVSAEGLAEARAALNTPGAAASPDIR